MLSWKKESLVLKRNGFRKLYGILCLMLKKGLSVWGSPFNLSCL